MKIKIKNLEELKNFAMRLSKTLKRGDFISLIGDLGAGKTTLVQFIGEALNIDEYITSPTFALVNIYDGNIQINHLDLYRFENPEEIFTIDYENYFYPEGITFVEWAERAEEFLPEDRIEININVLIDDEREIEIVENSKRGKEIGEVLNENLGN